MRAAAVCSRSAVSIFNSPIARSRLRGSMSVSIRPYVAAVDLRQDLAADRREVEFRFLHEEL